MAKQTNKESSNKLTLEKFFAKLQPEADKGIAPSHMLMLQRIKDRQRLINTHYSQKGHFSRYVKSHPLASLIEKKIQEEVELHRYQLNRLGTEQSIENVRNLSALDQYRLLVYHNYVDPSYLFSEVPERASLCELKNLSDAYLSVDDNRNSEKQQIIRKEFDSSLLYFQNRWAALTQQQISGPPLPPVAKLTQLVAPVPYSNVWTEELYNREAASMGHLQNFQNPAAGSSSASTAFSRPNGVTRNTSSNSSCDIEDIYQLAGAERLQQQRLSDSEARYNFPGNLPWGEDIFYDYAVMVPINQCDIPGEKAELQARSLEGAKVSAGFAKGILQYLMEENLAGSLGPDVAGGLLSILDEVINLPNVDVDNLPIDPLRWEDEFDEQGQPTSFLLPGARKKGIRILRRRLREKAGLLRSISRVRLLFQPGQNLDPLIAALQSGLDPFSGNKISNPNRFQPNDENNPLENNDDRGIPIPTLEIIDTNESGRPYDNVRNANFFDEGDPHDRGPEKPPGWFGLPNVKADLQEQGIGGGLFLASYSTTKRHQALRRYLQYLGGPFFQKLITLRQNAWNLIDALNRNRNQSTNVLAEFGRFSEGIVNDAVMAISRILEEIAEQLTLLPATKVEGSKRLVLMFVYRQFWFPEGYRAGKLVGYKNLLPNQKETLKRRTFVKTTRDFSTVREFTAAREEDFTRSSKETAELLNEASSDFNFSLKTSGGFDFFIVSGDVETNLNRGQKDMSKAMHNRVAEATMKSSNKYNEKREVKIRELTETEDLQEMTTEIENLNREITANYFYYQLHRQYFVATELAYVQPVLLRTREVPPPASVDEKFLANNAHILLHALPNQLSVDLQETAGEIDFMGRTLIRTRSDLDQKKAMYEQFRQSPLPSNAEERSSWKAQLETMNNSMTEARIAHIQAEENYHRARNRLDGVILHVRENICFYMQFIWQASPKIDQDRLLQYESFNGRPLGEVTRGFMRIGHYGEEEVFEYSGDSIECIDEMIKLLEPGYEIVADRTNQELIQSPLFQRLKRYYPADTDEMIIDRIRSQVFIRDPAFPEQINNTRRVQVAQDALVVEALPGQVPLLEGFQMAHRMLDVQKACLENTHLNERIKGRPWEQHGQDNYNVVRREGIPSVNIEIDKENGPDAKS